jgi:hypothetical protein
MRNMKSLISLFIEPDELVPNFETKTKSWYAFIFILGATLLSFFISGQLTIELILKEMRINDETGTYAKWIIWSNFTIWFAFLFAQWLFSGLFLTAILQLSMLNKRFATQPTFETLFRMTAYTSTILSIGDVIVSIMIAFLNTRGDIRFLEDLNVTIGLNIFFQKQDVGIFWYALLGKINPIVIWSYGTLAYLITENYHVSKNVVSVIITFLWIMTSLFFAFLQTFSA